MMPLLYAKRRGKERGWLDFSSLLIGFLQKASHTIKFIGSFISLQHSISSFLKLFYQNLMIIFQFYDGTKNKYILLYLCISQLNLKIGGNTMGTIKRIVLTGLIAALMLTSSAFAVGTEAESPVFIVEDDMLSQVTMDEGETQKIVTVSEIDAICDERLDAIAAGDIEEYDALTQTLRSYGVKEVSPAEVAALTGENTPITTASTTRNGITYETYNTTYTYNGTTYKILRILATPSSARSSVLYKNGSISIKNSKSAKANAMSCIGAGVGAASAIAVNKIGIAQTVYGFFSNVSNQLSSTSEITNIKANYVWNTAVACSFIHVKKTDNETFKLRGLYHKASASIAVTIPELSVTGNQNIQTSMLQKAHTGQATPVNYDSTLKAVQGYINNKQYQSSITSVNMTGIEKKTIKNVSLGVPMTPLEAGY